MLWNPLQMSGIPMSVHDHIYNKCTSADQCIANFCRTILWTVPYIGQKLNDPLPYAH